MAEKSFVMVSLKQSKARKLTQTLSNDTCREILEYLSNKKDATETQIAKDLKMPISTVHYNLKLLTEVNLVTTEEFHYSEKGKEVLHYKIANKYIIIAPDEDESLFERLKNFIPAIAVVAALTLGLLFLGMGNGYDFFESYQLAPDQVENSDYQAYSKIQSVPSGTEDAGGLNDEIMSEPDASPLARKTAEPINKENTAENNYENGLYFLLGGLAAILTFILTMVMRSKPKIKKRLD